MNSNPKLSYAIAAILSGAPAAVSLATDTAATTPSDSDAIQEIVVTAQRRSESIQNVPITIQAVTGDQLKQLNVQTFDDLLKYTPNVTFSGNGPGTGNIFIRGLSSGGSGNQSQSTTAPFPNVALYLDDQSMQFPARNNDVYLVDMARVEVLEGPQGTLFGGGAQAGAIRYITNKPKLGVVEGDFNGGYGYTAGGDPNNLVNGVLNVPIGDKLALRAVFFSDHRGGYISNVPSTIKCLRIRRPRRPTLPAIDRQQRQSGGQRREYGGLQRRPAVRALSVHRRLECPDSAELPELARRTAICRGLSPRRGWSPTRPLSDHRVPPPLRQGSLRKHGLDALAGNSRFRRVRRPEHGLHGQLPGPPHRPATRLFELPHLRGGSYYACSGAGPLCIQQSRTRRPVIRRWAWHDTSKTRIRVTNCASASDDNRFARWRGYWEDFIIKDQMNFNYLAHTAVRPANLAMSLAGGPGCVGGRPLPGFYATDPRLRTGSDTAFGEDVRRGYKQLAFFGSFDFDIIPKVLTLTYGMRHFHYDEFEEGSEFYSSTSSILNVPNGTPYGAKGAAAYGFGINLRKSENGNKQRANLSWHVTPDVLAYYTYSQGFRPGGFNRTSSNATGATGLKAVAPYSSAIKNSDQFLKPVGYDSDTLTNLEVGLKTEFLDHRLQPNVSPT